MKKIFLSFLVLILSLHCAYAQSDFYTHPDWAKSANIYEVNVRQYTKEGTFNAFEKELPRLKKMGVTILWLMPIYPIGVKERKGTLGSYYSVKDYRGVNPEFGTLDDLKSLVKAAHNLGMKVILDWVANHSAPDNPLVKLHPDWYKHDSTGKIIPPVPDWSDVLGFDYKSKELRRYQIESMKYWIKQADVDGFRCDVAMMVPMDFWKEVRLSLDSVKHVFMLAEGEGPEFHRNGFDMTYGWKFHHLMNQIAQGKDSAMSIVYYLNYVDSIYRRDDYIMDFTSNHDENSWNGSEYERMGDAAKTFAVLTVTFPGMPLIYSGQEAGVTKRIKFFDKDPIDWKNYPLEDFYTKLLALKTKNEALWNGKSGGKIQFAPSGNPAVLIFIRDKHDKSGRDDDMVITVLNLSGKSQSCNLNWGNGERKITEYFENKTFTAGELHPLQLEPWGYRVFTISKF